jgi:glutaredoxin
MKIRNAAMFIMMICSLSIFSQSKEIDLLKSEVDNVTTYYAKSYTREPMTIELNVEGTGFTTNVDMPAIVELKPFEKKEIVKITLDPSASSSYSISYKQYKTGSKSGVAVAPKPIHDRPELKKGIVVFSKTGCGKCTYAINYLKEKSIPFTEINISSKEEDEDYFWKVLKDAGFNGSSVQTPVIMIDGKVHYDMEIRSFMAGIK